MLVVLAIVFVYVAQSLAFNYSICREWSGHDFYNQFFWFNYDDPTHGLVDYVDQRTSRETNLSYVDPSTGRFVMKVDVGDPVPLHGNRSNMVRRSNRIHSKQWFEDGFYIIKATRMPTGCGVWPAFWTSTGDQWPEGGEIDIIEGVNGRGPNLSSLHTAKNCSIDARFNSSQLGNLERTDCAFQPGCASKYNDRLSFGHAFNNNGGGYFALMRDTRVNGSGIGVYFWPNNVKPDDIPDQVAAPPHKAPGTLDSDKMQKWGKPQAFFGYNDASDTQCDLAKHFGKHQIIFDTTLCGTWTNNQEKDTSGCPVSCVDFLLNHGPEYADARWEIDYVRLYANKCDKAHDDDDGAVSIVASTKTMTFCIVLGMMLVTIVTSSL